MTQLAITLGNSRVLAPEGWKLVSQSDDKLVLNSDRHQEATISLMRLNEDADFDQFTKLCDLHIKAAQKLMPDGFVQPDAQFNDRGTFGMLFFGDQKSCGRIFFGFVSLAKKELVTMFVEGIGIDPQVHAEDFRTFVRGLTRN